MVVSLGAEPSRKPELVSWHSRAFASVLLGFLGGFWGPVACHHHQPPFGRRPPLSLLCFLPFSWPLSQVPFCVEYDSWPFPKALCGGPFLPFMVMAKALPSFPSLPSLPSLPFSGRLARMLCANPLETSKPAQRPKAAKVGGEALDGRTLKVFESLRDVCV